MRQLTQNMEPSYLVGFLQALALQNEELHRRVEWVVDSVRHWSECYRRLPWFVVVINHPEILDQSFQGRHRPKSTFTVVSCNNEAYFKMNLFPLMYPKIYYISNDIEEMTYGQALELALHNKKIMSSTPGYNKLAPYTI